MPQFMTLRVEGVEETGRRLADFGRRAYKNGVSAGVRAAARVFVDAEKSKAPNRTGTLIKSMGVRLKFYPKSFTVFAATGARSSVKKNLPRRSGKLGVHRPSKIIHLLEYGHRIMPRGVSAKMNAPLHRAIAKEKKWWGNRKLKTSPKIERANLILDRRAQGRRTRPMGFMAAAFAVNARAIDAFKARFAEEIDREAARWSANP